MSKGFHICLYKNNKEVININYVTNIDLCRDLRILTIYQFYLDSDGSCISRNYEFFYDDFDKFEVNEI